MAEALRMMDAALDYLDGSAVAELESPALGGVLQSLSGISGRFAAVRASILARFDAAEAHDADGYGSSATWLAATGKMTRKAANAQVRQMRQLRDHPELREALAGKGITESWAAEMAGWTTKLPPGWRDEADKILVDAAAAGADLADLAIVAAAAYEKWRQSQGPDPDGGPGNGDGADGFEERYLRLGTTLDGAGRVTGDLTKECAEALQAILDALGKKAGPVRHEVAHSEQVRRLEAGPCGSAA